MRRLLFVLLLATVFGVAAQTSAPKLQSLPETPPPPPISAESFEPQVTITKRGDDKVEEFRLNGKLYMLKVTPPGGTAYYMIDQNGDGSFARQEAPGASLRVPMWVIRTF